MAQKVSALRAQRQKSYFAEADWASALEEFLDHVKARQEENTYDMYRAQLRLLTNWVDEHSITLHEFSARDLDRYLGWRKNQPSKRQPDKKISDSTRRKDALCCRVFIRFCFRRGLIDRDPLIDYKLPHGNRALPECPTEDQIRAFIKTIERYWDPERNPKVRYIPSSRRNFYKTRNIAIIVGLAQTGARESELLSLTLEDYDTTSLTVTFRDRKTDEDREVPIKQEWVDVVAQYLKWRPKASPSRTLFVNDYGEPVDPDVFGHAFRDMRAYANQCRICGGSGLKVGGECEVCAGSGEASPPVCSWTIHGLRHYAGSKLCDIAGIDKAQEILGHKSIQTTQLYNHIGKASLRAAFDRADLLPLSAPDTEVAPILVNKRSEKNRKRRLV
jgi:site-specific recombinase XerD